MKKSELFFNVVRLPVDFAMLLLAAAATYVLRTEILSVFRPVLFDVQLPLAEYLFITLISSLVFLACFAISGLYLIKFRTSLFDEFMRLVIACSAGIMVVILYIFIRQELFNSRFLVLGAWILAIIFVFIGRIVLRKIQNVMTAKKNFGVHRAVMIGKGEMASKIREEIDTNPEMGYRIIEQVDDFDKEQFSKLLNERGYDEVILADALYNHGRVAGIVEFCEDHDLTFRFVPNLYEILALRPTIDVVAGMPLIELTKTSLEGWGRVIKRIWDVIGSLLGLIVLSPVFLVIAIAIKINSPGGPVFVRLKRVTRNRVFDLLKFRSMIPNAHDLNQEMRKLGNDRLEAGPLWKMKNDPRITRVGKFIRRTRIDELPQLWNVLKGDMSMVGPRPNEPEEVSKYQRHHRKTLTIKAGATGLAQISGSSDIPFEEEVALDSFYIEHWSLGLDIKIILKTIVKMLYDRSAV